MNMNFQRLHGPELHTPADAMDYRRDSISKSSTQKGRAKYIVWPLFAAGVAYLAVNASAAFLLTIAGMFVALLGIAAWVCIWAQNETPW
jgi:hypothetical protein